MKHHKLNSEKCDFCEDIGFYYDHISIKFPIKCVCGGFIHSDTWGFDDGCGDSATYYTLFCDKCKIKSDQFSMPDYVLEFGTILEQYLKKIKECNKKIKDKKIETI